MKERFAVLLCAALGLCALAVSATTTPPQPSDAELLALLNPAERVRLNRATELLRAGRSDIESGEWLLSRKNSTTAQEGTVLDAKRSEERGREMVQAGNEKIRQAEASLQELRRIALARWEESHQLQQQAQTPLILPPAQWKTCLDAGVSQLLETAIAKDYQRVLFGRTHLFTGAQPQAAPALDEALFLALLAKDAGRLVVVNDPRMPFSMKTEGVQSFLDFPERAQYLQHYKTAVFVGEVLAPPGMQQTMLSLRLVDARTLDIIAEEMDLIANSEDFLALLPQETALLSKAASEVQDQLSLAMEDRIQFLPRLAQAPAPTRFRIEIDGVATDLETRLSLLAFKHTILRKSSMPLQDFDFLTLVFGQSDKRYPAHSDALWLLERQPGQAALRLASVHATRGTRLDVGTFTMERSQHEAVQP